jgi:hypothetical protein
VHKAIAKLDLPDFVRHSSLHSSSSSKQSSAF